MVDTINLLLQINDESEDETRGLLPGEEAVDADGRKISGLIRDVAAPTATDDGFPVGTTWINTSTERVYTCTSNAAGAAVWKQEINAVTGGGVEALGGITLDTLGSEADLAIAYPLVDGVIDAASHTDANRIGWFAHRGSGGGFGSGINSGGLIGAVVLGNLILEIGDNKVATNGDLTCGDDIIALDEVRARAGGGATDPKLAFHDNNGTYDPLTLQVGWWFDDVSNFIGTTVNGTHVMSTFADRVEVEPSTLSTLPTNGALVVGGGVGVGGAVRIGDNLSVDGFVDSDLHFEGTGSGFQGRRLQWDLNGDRTAFIEASNINGFSDSTLVLQLSDNPDVSTDHVSFRTVTLADNVEGPTRDWEWFRASSRTVTIVGNDIPVHGGVTHEARPYYSGGIDLLNEPLVSKTGTSDVTPDVSGFTGSVRTYWVRITATGDGVTTFDQFEWGIGDVGNSVQATGIDTTGSPQTLDQGVTVTFSATTGAAIGDSWNFTAVQGGPIITTGLAVRHLGVTTNVVIGAGSLTAPSLTAGNNVIIGFNAGEEIATGNGNVAIGSDALRFSAGAGGDPDSNVAVGFQAGKEYTADNSIFLGKEAGEFFGAQNDAIAIGFLAAQNAGATTGFGLVAVGARAARAAATATDTVVIGHDACEFTTSISESTIIGSNAAESCPTVTESVVIGDQAGQDAATTLFRSVIIGDVAARTPDDVQRSIIIGQEAAEDVTSVILDSVIIGTEAMEAATAGTGCIAIGNQAGQNNAANNKLYIGNAVGFTLIEGTDINSPTLASVAFNSTLESTTTTTGAVVTDGGLGVAKNINGGGALDIAGNATIVSASLNGSFFQIENFGDDWQYVSGVVYSDTDWHAAYFVGERRRGTSASPLNIVAEDILAGFEGKAWVNGGLREGSEWVAYCHTTPPGTGTTFDSRWDCIVNKEGVGQRTVLRILPDALVINPAALDYDFVVNKQTSGEALRYDAGLDTLTVGCTASFDGPIAATMPSYNRGWIAYSSGTGDLWENHNANVTLTGVTSGATATVIGSSGTASGRVDLILVSVGTDFIVGETVNVSGGNKDGTTVVVDSFQREVQQIQVAVADTHDVIAFGMVPDFLDLTVLGSAAFEGFGNFVFFCGQNDDFDIISHSFNADLVIEREFRGERDFTKQVRIGWEGIFGQISSHDTLRISFDPNGSTEFPRIVNFTDATAATSSTTGAVTIPNGGLGVGGDVHSGGNFEAVNRVIAGGDVIAGDDVTLADELRLGASDVQRASSFKVNVAVPAFAGNADTDGLDTYWRTQTGGAHSANNPRGGDIIVNFGVGGAGGTGRDGRFDIQGVLLKRSKVEVVSTSTTLSAESSKKVRQSAGGITTTLWATPVDGDEIWVRHASGGASNTIAGNGKNIEGAANFSLADGESAFLVFDATLDEWVIY